MNFERFASEFVRALRGKRSQSSFSRYLGYKSSVVHRWEAGQAWPSTSKLLTCCQRLHIDLASAYTRFFQRRPDWLHQHPPATTRGVAAFLRQLRGKTPIVHLSRTSGLNRFSLARWLKGDAEPNFPDFLRLVESMSRRMLDLLAALVDPALLPSLRVRWGRLQKARTIAYEFPLSHGVLRALELAPELRSSDSHTWLEETLGMTSSDISEALDLLQSSGQVERRKGVWYPRRVMAVNTGADLARAHAARVAWTRLAVERMESKSPGHYGYSLFAISRADLRKLRDLHVEYLRAMQDIIANSKNSECVALFCSQLLDLSTQATNALAPHSP